MMKERGRLAQEARKIAAEHKVSLRQAYRYAKAGRTPSDCVRIGFDGRHYHVRLSERLLEPLQVRRIRYAVAGVAKRANVHGFDDSDLAQLEAAAEQLNDLIGLWRNWRETARTEPCQVRDSRT